jgi:hypothetical protein
MGENLCQLYIDKGLITRIYMQFKKLNSPKINDPMKKWVNEQNRAFSKEEVQMAKKHMKKCSPSHKGNANKNPLRFHVIPVRMAIIKNTTTTNVGEEAGMGKINPHILLVGM